MPKAKDTETARLGHHLFTVDRRFCSIHYRGIIGKETDKTFLLNLRKGFHNYDKVLKTSRWLAVPGGVDPADVMVTFERVMKLHEDAVKTKREQLRVAEDIRFNEALAALDRFHPSTAETETKTEIGATAG
jgi:hypothetical protein